MSSVSSTGSTQITLQFSLERNIDAAAQDVQTAISLSARRLPDDMPSPPSFRKTNPAVDPILYLSLSSPILPLSLLDQYGQVEFDLYEQARARFDQEGIARPSRITSYNVCYTKLLRLH